ncbi:MAG: hypothetical protein KAI03_00490 [Candidatus Aureabacteria bacterium]|nr:hypothetical protein [Candidatus Auribacterota bacterium]
MTRNKRKKKFIGTRFQKKLLILMFASAVIPAGIVAVCLYYLIFNMLAWQMGIPEAIAYNLIPVVRKVTLIILIVLPITLSVIWIIALELSHRIAGPLLRLEKELDLRISGKACGPIKLRKNDELKLLADKINRLITKESKPW